MKKQFLVVLSFLLVFSVFGMQQMFNASDYEYQQTYSLCRAAGIETQQLVAPISADQIIAILKTIPEGRLSKTESDILNSLVNHLEKPYMVYGKDDYGFDAIITFCPDVFMHTSDEAVLVDESVEERRFVYPTLYLGGDVYFSKYFYGFFEYGIYSGKLDRQSHVSSNTRLKEFNIQLDTPYKSFVSAGKDKLNFSIGRNQLSLGKGKTGNLSLGDNFLFEDYAKVSYFNDLVSYDMTLISFDINKNYAANPLELKTNDLYKDNTDLVVVHQFSFKPFKWIDISVNEGMLQYGKNLLNDISILNPFMLLHNLNTYTEGTANNFFGIDLALALGKGFELNASLFFDQIQQRQELNDGKPGKDTPPNANAFLLNLIYSKPFMGGMADFYVEGVYTSPAVYLKEYENAYERRYTNYYDTDLIVGNALKMAGESDVHYLGYKYGPDTIVVATGFDYAHEKLQLSFDAMYKVHGLKGMKLYPSQQDYNDVGPEAFDLKSPTSKKDVYLPEQRVSFVLNAKYSPFDWLSIHSELGCIFANNYHNEIGKTFSDLQFAIGVKINPIHIAKTAVERFVK